MKIFYISRSTFPSFTANSIQVSKMCEAFSELGHEVILGGQLKTANPKEIFSFYDIKYPFRLIHIPSLRGSTSDVSYTVLSILKAQAIKPDLVYGRSLEACFGTSLLGIPTIYEIHKPPKKHGQRLFLSRLARASHFKRIVTISQGLANYLLSSGLVQNPCKICVAHDGAEPQEGTPLPAPGEFQKGAFNVGYIGSLYKGKGMEIISQLAPLCPWATFHIVGGGEKEISSWKNERNITENVKFYGAVPYSRTACFRSSFDVALLPILPKIQNVSGNFDEGWYVSPLKLFEYMASGIPVIASNLEAIKEIIRDGENGFLAPHNDIQKWQKLLLFLKENPEVRKRTGEKAREDFLKNFTWSVRARKVLEF